jgi:hypothetical protein
MPSPGFGAAGGLVAGGFVAGRGVVVTGGLVVAGRNVVVAGGLVVAGRNVVVAGGLSKKSSSQAVNDSIIAAHISKHSSFISFYLVFFNLHKQFISLV